MSWQPTLPLLRAMSQLNQSNQPQEEGRIELAIQAYMQGQLKSLRRAADAFNIT